MVLERMRARTLTCMLSLLGTRFGGDDSFGFRGQNVCARDSHFRACCCNSAINADGCFQDLV